MACARCGRETEAGGLPCSECRPPASLPPGVFRGGSPRLVLAAAALVLVAAVAGAVIVFAQARGQHPAADGRAPPQPGGAGVASGPVSPPVSRPASSGTATPSNAPGSSSAPVSTAPGSPPAVRVAIGPGAAAAPHRAAVRAFLTRYFTAINGHDYRSYLHLFGTESRRSLSAVKFQAGYWTTRDSAVTLTGLTSAGPGRLAATVTFTSHQSPAISPDHASCLHWRVTLYLASQGSHYLIEKPSAGFTGTHRSC